MNEQLIVRHGRIRFCGKMTHSLGLKNKKNSAVPSLKMYIIRCQCVLMAEGHNRRKDGFFLMMGNWGFNFQQG